MVAKSDVSDINEKEFDLKAKELIVETEVEQFIALFDKYIDSTNHVSPVFVIFVAKKLDDLKHTFMNEDFSEDDFASFFGSVMLEFGLYLGENGVKHGELTDCFCKLERDD